jgi:hypothetical protein
VAHNERRGALKVRKPIRPQCFEIGILIEIVDACKITVHLVLALPCQVFQPEGPGSCNDGRLQAAPSPRRAIAKADAAGIRAISVGKRIKEGFPDAWEEVTVLMAINKIGQGLHMSLVL